MYENFRKILIDRHIKVSDFSRMSGISQSTLSDWKTGRSTPKADKMQRIAECLDVSVEYLLKGNENENVMPNYNPVIHEIIELFDVLNNEQINMIVSITREMAKLNKNNNELTEQVKDYDEKIKYIDELEKDNDELSKKLDAYESYERFQAEEDW